MTPYLPFEGSFKLNRKQTESYRKKNDHGLDFIMSMTYVTDLTLLMINNILLLLKQVVQSYDLVSPIFKPNGPHGTLHL